MVQAVAVAQQTSSQPRYDLILLPLLLLVEDPRPAAEEAGEDEVAEAEEEAEAVTSRSAAGS